MSLLSIWRIPVLSFWPFLSLGCQWGRMSCIPAEFSYNPVGAWANFSADTLCHNTRQDNNLSISSWSSPQLYKLHIVWSCLPQPLLTVSSPRRPFSCQTLPRHLSCMVNKHHEQWDHHYLWTTSFIDNSAVECLQATQSHHTIWQTALLSQPLLYSLSIE